jgi:hypothetical protein
MRMLNDFEVKMGGDLIQGKEKCGMILLSELEVEMGSDLI